MPRFHDPSPPKAGPGMAFGKGLSGKRNRLKRKNSRKAVIGDDGGTNNNASFSSLANDPAAQIANDGDFSLTFQEEEKERNPKAFSVTAQGKKNKVNFFEETSSSSGEDEEPQPKKKHPPTVMTEARKPSSSTQPATTTTKPSTTNMPPRKNTSSKTAAPAKKKNTTKPSNKTATTKKKQTITTKSSSKGPSVVITAPKIKRQNKTTTLPPANTPTKTPPDRNAVTIQKDVLSSSTPVSELRHARSSLPSKDMPPLNRCAIGFDTRFLETDEGQETGRQLVNECHAFLEALFSRGATPCILAMSAAKEKKTNQNNSRAARRRNAVTVQAWTTTREPSDDQQQVDHSVVPVWIAPPINNENKVNRKAVHVPKPLLANDSWKHLGEMVESIIEEDAKRCVATKKKSRPLDITLVSNDLSLFCDTNEASHKRAISRFWDLVQPFNTTVRSIHVIMAQTGTVALSKSPTEDTATLSPAASASAEPEETGSLSEGDDHAASKKHKNEAQEGEEESEARSMHEITIVNCIRSLQAQLQSRAEDEYKKNRSSYAAVDNPIDITFSTVDATAHPRLGFRAILRRCLRDVVTSMTALSIGRPQSRVRLDLPETMDGTQCSVSLDVTYKTLPFALDRSSVTKAFFADLDLLADSKLEIIQLVPMSCIDASLLFGVPMNVRTGLEDDYEQYQEMLVLVRSLFRLMHEKDVAVLLRIHDQPKSDDDMEGDPNGKAAPSSGVFHATNRGQTFLLLAEEVVAGSSPPMTGLLFRYASAEELLVEQDKAFSTMDTSVPEDVAQQYESYVENALDILDCNAVNPLYLDATAHHEHSIRSSSNGPFPSSPYEDDDKIWNDKVGVGALAADLEAKKAISGLPLKHQDETSVDDGDDDDYNFYAFDYS